MCACVRACVCVCLLTFSMLHYIVILHALELNMPNMVTYIYHCCLWSLKVKEILSFETSARRCIPTNLTSVKAEAVRCAKFDEVLDRDRADRKMWDFLGDFLRGVGSIIWRWCEMWRRVDWSTSRHIPEDPNLNGKWRVYDICWVGD